MDKKESPFSDDRAVLETQYIFCANLLQLQYAFFGDYQIPIRKGIWKDTKKFFGKFLDSLKGKTPKLPPLNLKTIGGVEDIRTDDFDKEVFNYIERYWNPVYEENKNKPAVLGTVKEFMIGKGYDKDKVESLSLEDVDSKLKKDFKLPEGLGDLEAIAKETGLHGTDLYAYAYSQTHGAELMAVYNENGERSGRLYEIVTKMNRDILKEAIKQGKTVDQLRSNFVFPGIEEIENMIKEEQDEELQKLFMEHLNRDFFRLATTEMSIAYENGKRTQRIVEGRIYSRFEGGGSSNRKRKGVTRCEYCQDAVGTVLREFASEEEFKNSEYYGGKDLLKDDPYATHASWIGKSNFGLQPKQWMICTPMHPNCSCNQVSFNPGKKKFIDMDDLESDLERISKEVDKKYEKKEKSELIRERIWHEPDCSHDEDFDWVKEYLNR